MAEIVNHHTGDAPDLKHIHDNNGGVDAIETLARAHGADNRSAHPYSLRSHKNPQIWADMHDLMRPDSTGSDGKITDWSTDPPILYTPTYAKTKGDPALHREVEDAHGEVMGSDWDSAGSDEKKFKRLDNATAKRAVDRFKKFHKL
jgi:hypothetical protein